MQGLAAIPALASAAAVTDTLRIGSRVLCVDYHVPAVLAKSAATLDLLSDGRFELGLGAGWLRAEYRAMGVPFDAPSTRIDRLAEVVSLVKAHFSGEPIDVSGRHVSVSGYTGVPAPVSKPHPPIMIGGGSRKVLTLAGREADIVSLNFNNRAGVIGPDGVHTSTEAETARKLTWISEGAAGRATAPEVEIAIYFCFITDEGRAVAEQLGNAFGLSAEDMRAHPHALIGSVDEVCEQLEKRREMFGISYVTLLAEPLVPGSSPILDFAPVVERLAGR